MVKTKNNLNTKDIISIDEESAHKQRAKKNWCKLSTLLVKTLN